MTKSSRALMGGVVALGLVSSGSAVGYRSQLLTKRRAEIETQQLDLTAQLQAAQQRATTAEVAHGNSMRAATEMKAVVETIWSDRKSRYERSVKDMESYMVAAPEYRRAARAQGLSRAAPQMLASHSYDPFVRVMGEHVVTMVGADDAPRSIKEASDAFAFCHTTLEKAIESAQNRLVTERTVVPTSPSLPTQALSTFLSRLRAKGSSVTLAAAEAEGERLKRHKADLRVLHTHADIRAAITYSEQLLSNYRNLIIAAKQGNVPSPFADEEVMEAAKQISVWRHSVLTFLLQEQAQRALDSYSLCIADTMTQLVNEGLPDAIKAAGDATAAQ